MHGLSIIIPTRNEADNIDPLLQRIFAVELPGALALEVVFVDDRSCDGTRERIRRWCEDGPVRLIERENGGSLASAVIVGARQASFDLALVMDADLSHPPEKIPDLLAPLLEGGCDMVIGSRYVDGGATPEWPLRRKIASKLATLPARVFTDVNDPLAGFFATATTRLGQLRPDVPGFKIGLEVLAVGGDRLRVREVPIVFHDRFEGFSKMNKRIVFEYLLQVVQLIRIDTALFTPAVILALIGVGTAVDLLIFWAAGRWGLTPVEAHLAGSAAASLFLFTAMYLGWRNRAPENSFTARLALGLLLVMLFSAALQGALFQFGSRIFAHHPYAALVPAALAAAFSATLLGVLYLFSGLSGLAGRVQAKTAAIGGVLLLIILRLAYLGLPELMEQEAYYWNYARHLALSYLDHPPLVAVLVRLGTGLFGLSEFGVRFGAFLSWLVTAFFVYRLTSDIFNRTAAWGALLLLSILPLYFGTGLVITPDAPLHAAWAAFIYFLHRATVTGSAKSWLGVGLGLGIALLSKYTIVLLGPGIFLFLLIDRRARSWFLRPEPYGALAIGLILCTPVLIWNHQHDWVSFLFQGEQRVGGATLFTTPRLLAYITLQLTPAGLLGLLYFLFRGKSFFRASSVIDSVAGGDNGGRSYLLLLLLILSPLAVYFFFSLSREVKLNWTSPVWLAALPFLGCTVTLRRHDWPSRFLSFVQWLWKITGIILFGGYCLFLHYFTLGLPGVEPRPGLFLLGWEQLAVEVEALADRIEAETGKRPLVVGMDPYQIGSGLAFYRARLHRGDERLVRRAVEETVGWHLFGWNGLMYEFWGKPEEFHGRDVIAVASSMIRVDYLYFRQRFLSLEEIRPLDISKNGRFVKRYYYRVIRDYRPARN